MSNSETALVLPCYPRHRRSLVGLTGSSGSISAMRPTPKVMVRLLYSGGVEAGLHEVIRNASSLVSCDARMRIIWGIVGPTSNSASKVHAAVWYGFLLANMLVSLV